MATAMTDRKGADQDHDHANLTTRGQTPEIHDPIKIGDELYTLERADQVVRLIADAIVQSEYQTNRYRWVLGDYYNALCDRYGRDQVLNAIHLPPDHPITIATIEDYADVCRAFPESERDMFVNFDTYLRLLRDSRSYARRVVGVSPHARFEETSPTAQAIETHAETIRRAVLEMREDEPDERSLIHKIHHVAAEIYPDSLPQSSVAITHKSMRPPLTIQYDAEMETTPLGAITGEMTGLEYAKRIVRTLGLSGKQYRIELRMECLEPGFEDEPIHTLTGIINFPKRGGEPYHIEGLIYDVILKAQWRSNDEESSAHL